MTTAEPWWARVQQPHVARRTNRANTVRQLRTIVLPSYQTWCTARRAAQRFGAPLASPIARKQGVGSIQMASRSRWRSRRPAVWPPRLEQATIVETAKAAPQDDPSTRAGQGSRKTIRRVLWRWEQPQSHRSPRMHTIWSSGRNRESYRRPLVQLPKEQPATRCFGISTAWFVRASNDMQMKSHPSSAMPLHSDAPIGGTPIQSDAGPPLSGQHPHPHSDDSSQGPCQAAPRSPRFVWRRAARHHQLRLARQPLLRRLLRLSRRRAAQHPCSHLARRLPLRRLGQPSRRRAAPRSPRLAWRHSRLRRARLPSLGAALVSALALDSRVSCCVGGLGGFRAAVLRRPRLVSLGAALLGIITFASPVGRRFGWLGRPLRRRAAPRFPRFTGRRTAQPRRLCLVRRPPLRRLWRLSLRRARLASLGAALLGTITFASRVGRRYDGFGGLRAAALRCARLCLAHRLPLRRLWRLSLDSAALLSPIALT